MKTQEQTVAEYAAVQAEANALMGNKEWDYDELLKVNEPLWNRLLDLEEAVEAFQKV